MMKINIPGRVQRDISRFAEDAEVSYVILFGSRARGTNTDRSDIDLAVRGGDFNKFYWNVKEKTHTLLMFDIVDLDENVSDELAEEIRKDGVVLYEKTGKL